MDLEQVCKCHIARGMGRSLAGDLREMSSLAIGELVKELKRGIREELTPPLSQIKISLQASGFSDGKNQKYSCEVSFSALVIGMRPAYDSPMSKSTSGIAVPLTEYSTRRSVRALIEMPF